MMSRIAFVLLAAMLPTVSAHAQLTDIFNVRCPGEVRVGECLGGSLSWRSKGASLTEDKPTVWYNSEHIRLRRLASVDSVTWEYMRSCEPWSGRYEVLDTLRIVHSKDGGFREIYAVPYRSPTWTVAGVTTTTRDLMVEDTIAIAPGSLPRKARTGCLARYRRHTFQVLLLRTTDDGPVHRYAWTEETGILYMWVPDEPIDDEVQAILQFTPSTATFKLIQPGNDRRKALFTALASRILELQQAE
jgi:hypothetical protein